MNKRSGPEADSIGTAGFDYHQLFWTWHLNAGLFAAPLLLVIALTGAVLVYPGVIERWMHPELWVVIPQDTCQSNDVLVSVVAEAYPDFPIFSYKQAIEPEGSWLFWLRGKDKGFLEVFVDPYSGKVLGERWRERSFLRITEQLHRRLLTGKLGSMVVDLITGWTIVLLLTGLYLWWPRNWRGLKKGLTVPMKGSARKINWRLHNSIGFYSSILMLLLCLTGMVVSEVTGAGYRIAMFASGAFPKSLISPPESQRINGQSSAKIPSALKVARETMNFDGALEIRLPQDEKGSFLVATHLDSQDFAQYQAVIIHQYTGELIEHLDWGEAHALMKIRTLSLAIHFGAIGGSATKAIAFAICLIVPIIIVTGYLVWWWKRLSPKKQIAQKQKGQEREKEQAPMPLWLRLMVLTFSLLFLSVGVSLACIWCWNRIRMWMWNGDASKQVVL